MANLIEIQNVSKSFREGRVRNQVLNDIDLNIKDGEFFVLLGPSGSGKSTLLRIIAGLIQPTKGQIQRERDLRQSFIFQNFALFPWLTVYENVAFGLTMQEKKDEDIHTTVEAEIERMGLKGHEKAYPRELSGGMKQRVGIARALVVQPEIILLDEPFSALDSFTASKLRTELLDIWKERNVTVIMVTHLIEEALQLGDRIAVLTQRPGTIDTIIENSLPRPRNLRSTEFYHLFDKINNCIKV